MVGAPFVLLRQLPVGGGQQDDGPRGGPQSLQPRPPPAPERGSGGRRRSRSVLTTTEEASRKTPDARGSELPSGGHVHVLGGWHTPGPRASQPLQARRPLHRLFICAPENAPWNPSAIKGSCSPAPVGCCSSMCSDPGRGPGNIRCIAKWTIVGDLGTHDLRSVSEVGGSHMGSAPAP